MRISIAILVAALLLPVTSARAQEQANINNNSSVSYWQSLPRTLVVRMDQRGYLTVYHSGPQLQKKRYDFRYTRFQRVQYSRPPQGRNSLLASFGFSFWWNSNFFPSYYNSGYNYGYAPYYSYYNPYDYCRYYYYGYYPQYNPPGYNPPGYGPGNPPGYNPPDFYPVNPPGYGPGNPPGYGPGFGYPGFNPPGYNPPGYGPGNPPGYNPPGAGPGVGPYGAPLPV